MSLSPNSMTTLGLWPATCPPGHQQGLATPSARADPTAGEQQPPAGFDFTQRAFIPAPHRWID